MYCIIEQLNLMNSLTGENIIGFKNLRTGSYYLQYSFLQYQFHSTMENVSIAKSFLIGSWPEEDLQMEKCTHCDCTSSGFEIRILASSLKVTLSSRICIHHLYKLWPVRKWFSCKKMDWFYGIYTDLYHSAHALSHVGTCVRRQIFLKKSCNMSLLSYISDKTNKKITFQKNR